MSAFPPAFRVAQAVGLTGAAWLSGNIFTFSLNSAPAIVQSVREDQLPPSAAVKLWSRMYSKGKAQNPPIAAVTAAAFLYLAWAVREGTPLFPLSARHSSYLYSAAAALTLGIVPYTLAVMIKTNNALLSMVDTKKPLEASYTEVEPLLQRWACLNAIRGLFPLVGGIVGLVTAFH